MRQHALRSASVRLPRPVRACLPLLAGWLSAAATTVATGALASLLHRGAIAAQALTAAAAIGAAVTAASTVLLVGPPRLRIAPATLAAGVAAAFAITGLGVANPAATAPGTRIGCLLGVPRCIATEDAAMPMLVRSRGVQRHPVVHAILWGAGPATRSTVRTEVRDAARLGQPLLRRDYGVAPATPGGSWVAPGSATAWLRDHRMTRASTAVLRELIRHARQAEHWADTPDTQWWIATPLTPQQLDLPAGSCADHIHVPGVRGVVVRLSLAGCAEPATVRVPTSCRALTTIDSSAPEPATRRAGIQLLIGHEFAEAATDPANGWRVLVSPRCGSDMWLEIADVCQPDGVFIRAPGVDTAVGWQPALLAPPADGRPARCVDPAHPNVALGRAAVGGWGS